MCPPGCNPPGNAMETPFPIRDIVVGGRADTLVRPYQPSVPGNIDAILRSLCDEYLDSG